jgi:hypothetical protein
MRGRLPRLPGKGEAAVGPNGHMTDVVGPSNSFARSKPLERFRTLVGCQGRWAAKSHATGFCTGSAVAGTRQDQ